MHLIINENVKKVLKNENINKNFNKILFKIFNRTFQGKEQLLEVHEIPTSSVEALFTKQ